MARANQVSLFNACTPAFLAAAGIKSGTAGKIMEFHDMIADANARLATEDAFAVAALLSNRSGLYASFKMDNSIESQSRAANIEELLNSVKSFVEDRQNQYKEELLIEGNVTDVDSISDSELPVVTLGDFLEDISLLSAIDMSDDEDANNKITLMTIHSSKGLEFPYVYVAGMEENLFPSGGAYASPTEIEEERRLFYVALTRAKAAVNLSFAATRMRNGKHEQNSPSRFVEEIDSRYVDNPLDDSEMSSGRSGGFSGFGSGFGSGASFSGRRNVNAGRGASSGYGGGYDRSGGSSYGKSGPVKVIRQTPVSSATGKPMVSMSRAVSSPAKPRTPDSQFTPVSVLDVKAGQRVEHNRFGYGVVQSITGTGDNLKANILFDSCGEKIILLKYAKIRVDNENK